jgi:hypothetical protein
VAAEDATPILASRVIVKRFRPLKDRNSVLNAPKVSEKLHNSSNLKRFEKL